MKIVVAGGASFIGGNFVLDWIAGSDEPVINLGKRVVRGAVFNVAEDIRKSSPSSLTPQLSGKDQAGLPLLQAEVFA